MVKLSVFCGLWMMPLLLLACGSGSRPTTADDGHGHGASYACGTEEEPVTLILKDIAPAVGTTVANKSIVQKFTLVDPPGLLSQLTIAFMPKHTAGMSSPNRMQFTIETQGKDHVYSATVDSWATAPGHVELADPGRITTDSGCVLKFPEPLFSYDISTP